jgi:CheY-like chemotaxis protein/HPt (histidine-containing phosphotransfer) domain-containing protein
VIVNRSRRNQRINEFVHSLDGSVLRRQALLHVVGVAAGILPEESDAVTEETSREALKEMPPLHPVLVAEDDEISRRVIQQQLQVLGYQSELVGNGAEALEAWRSGHYSLLLTDLNMPVMDGYQLSRSIRQEETAQMQAGLFHLPIVALSANAMHGEADRVHAAGMDDFLTKPVPLDRLEKVLARWLPRVVASLPAPTTTPPDTTVFEVDVLKGLIGADPNTLQIVLQGFQASAANEAQAISRTAATREFDAAVASAHKLKAAARAVGALALGNLCDSLEHGAQQQDATVVERLAADIAAQMAEVDARIGEFLAVSPADRE